MEQNLKDIYSLESNIYKDANTVFVSTVIPIFFKDHHNKITLFALNLPWFYKCGKNSDWLYKPF